MDKLKNKVLKTVEILENARRLMYDSYKMRLTDDVVKYSLISRDRFLSRVCESFFKLSIIEMAKLYSGSTNDKYRLRKLLNDLLEDHALLKWKRSLVQEELQRMLGKIKSKEVKKKINDLLELRNKHFAHTDIPEERRNIHDIELYYGDLEYLIDLASEILKKVALSLFDKEIKFESYKGEEMDMFINEIIRDREELGAYRLKDPKQ